MTDRIPLDHLTHDQYDALCEQLEAAEASESQRQLAAAREALASAATRAARAEAALARARQARRRINSALIAVEPLLTKPYPDDPRWTPWTRFVQPALRALGDALAEPAPGPTATQATDGPDHATRRP